MTNDLAKLLDGPVAERFGYPVDGHRSLRFTPHMPPARQWEWVAKSVTPGEPAEFVMPQVEAEALWLAHLIGVCGEMDLRVTIEPALRSHIRPCQASVASTPYGSLRIHKTGSADTLLAALAAAMLAVPETQQTKP